MVEGARHGGARLDLVAEAGEVDEAGGVPQDVGPQEDAHLLDEGPRRKLVTAVVVASGRRVDVRADHRCEALRLGGGEGLGASQQREDGRVRGQQPVKGQSADSISANSLDGLNLWQDVVNDGLDVSYTVDHVLATLVIGVLGLRFPNRLQLRKELAEALLKLVSSLESDLGAIFATRRHVVVP